MEIPINASLGNNRDEADVGPITDGGGGSGSRPDAVYREVLDELFNQVIGKHDFDNAYATFTMAARSHVKLGMPLQLMFEYQDTLSARYAKLQEPVPAVQNIETYQNNTIGTNTGTLQGDINQQDIKLGQSPIPNSDPKLLE